MEQVDVGRRADAPMPSLVGDVYGRWFKFLSRWALFAGLVNVGLFLFYGLWFVPASQGSPLPPQYDELSAAISAPVLHRFAIAFDVAAWLVLGVFIIALAAVLTRRTPIRSVFIAACSIGAVAGLIGAFVRLDGVGNLAARYEAAAPDQQEALLRSYLDLQLVINSGFTAGGLLWGIAFVLVASAAWRAAEFPRWLAGLIAVPGILNVAGNVFWTVTGKAALDGIVFTAVLLLPVIYFAVAGVFWRESPAKIEG